MYQDTTRRLLNHSESCQVYKVASLLTEALKSSRRVGRRCLRIAQHSPQHLDHTHIELTPRLTCQLLEGFRRRTLGPVALGTVPVVPAPKHHVVGVHRRHYARSKRDLLPFETIGVTSSVRALVVVPDHRDRPRQNL